MFFSGDFGTKLVACSAKESKIHVLALQYGFGNQFNKLNKITRTTSKQASEIVMNAPEF